MLQYYYSGMFILHFQWQATGLEPLTRNRPNVYNYLNARVCDILCVEEALVGANEYMGWTSK